MSPLDRHAKDQLNVRLDPDLLARLKDGAKRHGQTVTDIVARGAEAELDRLDSITIPETAIQAPVFLAAEDRSAGAGREELQAPGHAHRQGRLP